MYDCLETIYYVCDMSRDICVALLGAITAILAVTLMGSLAIIIKLISPYLSDMTYAFSLISISYKNNSQDHRLFSFARDSLSHDIFLLIFYVSQTGTNFK